MNFLGSRGMRTSVRRGRKFRTGVARCRTRRSRFPVRHAPSRPRRASSRTSRRRKHDHGVLARSHCYSATPVGGINRALCAGDVHGRPRPCNGLYSLVLARTTSDAVSSRPKHITIALTVLRWSASFGRVTLLASAGSPMPDAHDIPRPDGIRKDRRLARHHTCPRTRSATGRVAHGRTASTDRLRQGERRTDGERPVPECRANPS